MMSIAVRSDGGTFHVNEDTGMVEYLDGTPEQGQSHPECANITQFDVDEYRVHYGHLDDDIDIRAIGYWINGEYVPPEDPHRTLLAAAAVFRATLEGQGDFYPESQTAHGFPVQTLDSTALDIDGFAAVQNAPAPRGDRLAGLAADAASELLQSARRDTTIPEPSDSVPPPPGWSSAFRSRTAQDIVTAAQRLTDEAAALRRDRQNAASLQEHGPQFRPNTNFRSELLAQTSVFQMIVAARPRHAWVPLLLPHDYVWLMREQQLAMVSTPFFVDPLPGDYDGQLRGRIGLRYGSEQQTHLWFVDASGNGQDGQPLIAPAVLDYVPPVTEFVPLANPNHHSSWLYDYGPGYHLWLVPTNEVVEVASRFWWPRDDSMGRIRLHRYNEETEEWYQTDWYVDPLGRSQNGTQLFLPLRRAPRATGSPPPSELQQLATEQEAALRTGLTHQQHLDAMELTLQIEETDLRLAAAVAGGGLLASRAAELEVTLCQQLIRHPENTVPMDMATAIMRGRAILSREQQLVQLSLVRRWRAMWSSDPTVVSGRYSGPLLPAAGNPEFSQTSQPGSSTVTASPAQPHLGMEESISGVPVIQSQEEMVAQFGVPALRPQITLFNQFESLLSRWGQDLGRNPNLPRSRPRHRRRLVRRDFTCRAIADAHVQGGGCTSAAGLQKEVLNQRATLMEMRWVQLTMGHNRQRNPAFAVTAGPIFFL